MRGDRGGWLRFCQGMGLEAWASRPSIVTYCIISCSLVFQACFLFIGIWAENEEEEDRPRFSSGRSAKDYTAPVNFISGGIKIGDRVMKEEEEDNITVG